MREILVVVSRVKAYIKKKGPDMSTSADTMDALTDIVEKKCDAAIENAKKDKRKTVMRRDFL